MSTFQRGDVVTHCDENFPGEFIVDHSEGNTVLTMHPRAHALTASNLTLVRRPSPWAGPRAPITMQSIADKVRELSNLQDAGRITSADIERIVSAPRPPRPRMLLIDRLGFERIEEWGGGHSHFIAVPGRNGGHHLTVRFDSEGYRERGGETFVLYREAGEQLEPTFVQPKRPPPLTVERLSRSLFESDHDVIAFVAKVSDSEIAYLRRGIAPPEGVPAGSAASINPERSVRAMQIAWERNEGSWRDRAKARAASMLNGSLKGS